VWHGFIWLGVGFSGEFCEAVMGLLFQRRLFYFVTRSYQLVRKYCAFPLLKIHLNPFETTGSEPNANPVCWLCFSPFKNDFSAA
jgi:hypothetical protein